MEQAAFCVQRNGTVEKKKHPNKLHRLVKVRNMVCAVTLRSEGLWGQQGGGTGRSQLNLGCIHYGPAVFSGGPSSWVTLRTSDTCGNMSVANTPPPTVPH